MWVKGESVTLWMGEGRNVLVSIRNVLAEEINVV
jgi:hypothetical protein